MVLSKDPNAPLFVLIGVTGSQGRSVVKHFIESSDKPYRFRGITRDASSDMAQKLKESGVEIVEGDFRDVETQKNIFTGASYIWANLTSFKGQYFDEISLGKQFIDTAKAICPSLSLFVWSGAVHVGRLSGGKYPNVPHYQDKAIVDEYGFESGVPFASVVAGMYMTNLSRAGSYLGPKKQDDGTYLITIPNSPETVYSMIDIEDYGLYVLEAVEHPDFGPGSTIYAASQELSYNEIWKQWSEILGVPHVIKRISIPEFRKALKFFAEELAQMYEWVGEFGHYGGVDLAPSQKGLAKKTGTWEDFVRRTDWTEVLEGKKL